MDKRYPTYVSRDITCSDCDKPIYTESEGFTGYVDAKMTGYFCKDCAESRLKRRLEEWDSKFDR